MLLAAVALIAARPARAPGADAVFGGSEKIRADLTPLREGEAHPGVMRPDAQTRRRRQEMSPHMPRAAIDPGIKNTLGAANLLSHLNYTPAARDQGSCGNSWAWAGTACFAIALHVQAGVWDSLSVQHINSCYTSPAGYACCGGWSLDLADFFKNQGYCIPWSNTNAAFQDGSRTCGSGASAYSCASLGTSPRYDIDSCAALEITTHGVDQATAIANIKNVLNQGKAVWFAFAAPNQAASDSFHNFWNNYSQSHYLGGFLDNQACGKTWDEASGWIHAVLCYGYNDNDPENPVWFMLNSWGTTTQRPQGRFYVDMDINYSCQYADGGSAYYNYWWDTFDIDFDVPPPPAYRVFAKGDYDNDNFPDIAVFRPSTGKWAIRNLSTVYYGSSGDIPVPGDYNNDGRADVAVFKPSTGKWAIRSLSTVYYGSSGDIPVPGDYDNDGRTDIAVFRPATGKWAIRGLSTVYLGSASDLPAPGAYANGTKTEVAIFRPATGLWAIRGQTRFHFGATGDYPVPGNYTTSQHAPWKAAVFRSPSGLWAVRGITRCNFGINGDQPVPADFAGTWGDEFAIFRPPSGLWSVRNYGSCYYGTSGDVGVTR